MSDKQPPRNVGGSDGGSDGDDEDGTETKENRGVREKGKRVSLFWRRKGKMVLNQRRNKKGIYVNTSCWGRSGSGGCFSCLKQPRTMDSSGESSTSDPNSSEFTFNTLRGLIEKNDFNCQECNPHLDIDGI